MKPHILVISNYSGNITPIRPEAEIFLGLARQGFRVTVMTPGNGPFNQAFETLGCRIIDYRAKSKFDITAIKLIRNAVSEFEIDIIHAFNSKAIANSAWAIWSNRKVKLVSYRGYTGNIRWYDPANYLSFLNPRIDYMVCLAESVREQYLRNGVSHGRTITINKGHDPQWYAQIDAADLSGFGFPEKAMVCSFVANRRTKMKGIAYLIEAASLLPEDLPIYFLMIGRDIETKEIKAQVAHDGIGKRFVFTGFRNDASSIVKACDVSISVSIFGEATQKAMIEAMYLGNPVILSDIPGNRGMVIHGKGGLIVPPGNARAIAEALVRLYEDPELRQKMGAEAARHISHYLSLERTIGEYKEFYERITGNTA